MLNPKPDVHDLIENDFYLKRSELCQRECTPGFAPAPQCFAASPILRNPAWTSFGA
jgi:hypothetical protein